MVCLSVEGILVFKNIVTIGQKWFPCKYTWSLHDHTRPQNKAMSFICPNNLNVSLELPTIDRYRWNEIFLSLFFSVIMFLKQKGNSSSDIKEFDLTVVVFVAVKSVKWHDNFDSKTIIHGDRFHKLTEYLTETSILKLVCVNMAPNK